jgi:hypothetical protein
MGDFKKLGVKRGKGEKGKEDKKLAVFHPLALFPFTLFPQTFLRPPIFSVAVPRC